MGGILWQFHGINVNCTLSVVLIYTYFIWNGHIFGARLSILQTLAFGISVLQVSTYFCKFEKSLKQNIGAHQTPSHHESWVICETNREGERVNSTPNKIYHHPHSDQEQHQTFNKWFSNAGEIVTYTV